MRKPVAVEEMMPAMSPNPRDSPMRKLAYLWGDDSIGGVIQKAAFSPRKLFRAAFSYMERWLFSNSTLMRFSSKGKVIVPHLKTFGAMSAWQP